MLRAFKSGTKKLISPSFHQWFRPQLIPTAMKVQWVVDIGITDRGLDDIGDINAIVRRDKRESEGGVPFSTEAQQHQKQNNNTCENSHVKRGEIVLDIHWDGHIITTADELYHTVWETVEGVTSIKTPIAGGVEFIGPPSAASSGVAHSAYRGISVDEDTVLTRILVEGENDMREFVDSKVRSMHLVEEVEYLKMIRQDGQGLDAGKFNKIEGLA